MTFLTVIEKPGTYSPVAMSLAGVVACGSLVFGNG